MSAEVTQPVQGGGARDSELMRTCWDGVALIDQGWRPTRVAVSADGALVVLSVQTPGRRIVEVRHPQPVPSRDDWGACGTQHAAAVRLARRVAVLARRAPQDVEYLKWFWTAVCGRREPVVERTEQIPDPALGTQSRALRQCYWLLSSLVCELGWQITDLGSPVAGCGFVADVPGEVAAVFPAGMRPDGTAGAELAWRLRDLPQCGREYLSRQNRFTLTRSREAIGLQAVMGGRHG